MTAAPMGFDEKARENLQAVDRLLPDDDGVGDCLASAVANRADCDAALKRRGETPLESVRVDAFFEEVRPKAKEHREVVWKRLETGGVVGEREEFEALAAGSIEPKEGFARACLQPPTSHPSGAKRGAKKKAAAREEDGESEEGNA